MVPCDNIVLSEPWGTLDTHHGNRVCRNFSSNGESPAVLSHFAACAPLIQPAIAMTEGNRAPTTGPGSCLRPEVLQAADFPNNSCTAIVKKQGSSQFQLSSESNRNVTNYFPHLRGRGDVLTTAFYTRSPITGREVVANLHFVMNGSRCELADTNFDGLRLTPALCQGLNRGPIRPCSSTITENCFDDPGTLQRTSPSSENFTHCLTIRMSTPNSRPTETCLSREVISGNEATIREQYGFTQAISINSSTRQIPLTGATIRVISGNNQHSRIEQKPMSEYLKFKIQQARTSCALFFPAARGTFSIPTATEAARTPSQDAASAH